MNPVFRVLSRWTQDTDEAIYDTVVKTGSLQIFAGVLVRFAIIVCSLGCAYKLFFEWGIRKFHPGYLIVAIALIFAVCYSVTYICRLLNERNQFLDAKAASRKEKASGGEYLLATLFYPDHLVQYNVMTSKSLKLKYTEIHRIHCSHGYILLMSTNEDSAMVCLEMAGFSGMSPQDALKWLAARCKCRVRT